jgi:hypothetical protein
MVEGRRLWWAEEDKMVEKNYFHSHLEDRKGDGTKIGNKLPDKCKLSLIPCCGCKKKAEAIRT